MFRLQQQLSSMMTHGKFEHVNAEFVSFFGYTEKELETLEKGEADPG